MNQMFGNERGDPNNIDWARLENQCKNIPSEYNELKDALRDKDVEKARDALCDLHVFLYGAHHLMGIDADRDMRTVVNAVFTRFCKDETDLEATKAKYDRIGVTYYVEGEFPFVRLKSDKDQGAGEWPKDKFLKSASFKEPEFEPVPEAQREGPRNARARLTPESFRQAMKAVPVPPITSAPLPPKDRGPKK